MLTRIPKREIVWWLAQSRDVSQLMGRRQVVYALGSLNADNAAPLVTEVLDRTESIADQRWAIRSLSRMGTSDATNVITRVLTASCQKSQPNV